MHENSAIHQSEFVTFFMEQMLAMMKFRLRATKNGGKKNKAGYTAPQSRAGGQGPYLRSPDHLGRSSRVKE